MRNTKLSGSPVGPSRMRRNSKPPSRARALCFSNGISSARLTFMAYLAGCSFGLSSQSLAQIIGQEALVDGSFDVDRPGQLAGKLHALDHRVDSGLADVAERIIVKLGERRQDFPGEIFVELPGLGVNLGR